MKILCTICARGNSKGLVKKNTKFLKGIPLICHSIKHAFQSKIFNEIAVTSDSDEILDLAKKMGITYAVKRPKNLATDSAAKIPVIKHCTLHVEKKSFLHFDYIIDLDVTAPLRNISDIIEVKSLLVNRGIGNVLSCTPSRKSPYFNLVEVDQAGIPFLSKTLERNLVRRQDSPACYDLNGSVYGWERSHLMEEKPLITPDTRLHIMPSIRGLDIDDELEFKFVEFLMGNTGLLTS